MMMEISNVITTAGITLSKTNDTQLTAAIQHMITSGGVGFPVVQQGGGAGQGANKVYIGWSADGSGLRAQVDATDLGLFGMTAKPNVWNALQTFNASLMANDIGASGNIHTAGGTVSGLDVVASRSINAALNLSGGTVSSGSYVSANNGNVTANNGKLRASFGSGGDPNAAVLLNEFGNAGGTSASITAMPGGFMLVSNTVGCSGIPNADTDPAHIGATGIFNFAWPTVFPTVCYGAWGVGWDSGIQEGSEMSVGLVNWTQAGGTARVNRASGSNPAGSETFIITMFGIGR